MCSRYLRPVVLIMMLLIVHAGCAKEKIGILFIDVGTPEENDLRFYTDFFGGNKDIFYPGWFAGGDFEGNTCYTLIHYADEAEAAICGVEAGTRIDAFCNKYEGNFVVESLVDLGPDGDNSFNDDCYAPAFPFPYIILRSHSTVDPNSGAEIMAPVVRDPQGSGIGIPDFFELSTFNRMHWLYTLPGKKDPHRKLALKFFYGNDAPGYEPDTPELLNLKDALADALTGYELVYRHGWEGYMENHDAYGNSALISDSTETAIEELIKKEKVKRIVVFPFYPEYNNSVEFGHEWRDENGAGVSALPGKTFRECVEDITDGKGPATLNDLNQYLQYKPFDKHWQHVFPLIEELVKKYDAHMPVSFSPPFGSFDEYHQAGLETVNYVIEKYAIPRTASLLIVVAHHGFYSAYMKAQECDAYFRLFDELTKKSVAFLKQNLDWAGTLEVKTAGIEFAEGEYDFPSKDKPTGNVLSAGELIDSAINGRYVNAIGEEVNNGTDKFDYIIVNPYNRTESQDTLFGIREETHGNFVYVPGRGYRRDKNDKDGAEWQADDVDEEFYSVRVFDGTGWPSYPGCLDDPDCRMNNEPIFKGSAEKPTTIIVCGAITANSCQTGRKGFIAASLKSILSAIENPHSRGVH